MILKDEDLTTRQPTAKYCRTCKNALKSVTIKDYVVEKFNFSNCDAYSLKPDAVLWEDAECPKYERK